MFNKLGKLADLMRNAGKIREAVEKATESLGQVEVEGDAGGGAVTAKVNGRLEVVSVRIDPKLLADGDAELLEDLVTAAVNPGLVKAREAAAQSLSSLAGGLPLGLIPGFAGLARSAGERGRGRRLTMAASGYSARRRPADRAPWAGCPGSARRPPSGWPTTCSSARPRRRSRWPRPSATPRTRSATARSAST